MALGDRYFGNPESWVDKEFGYTVIKPINVDRNRHLYFTANTFTCDGKSLILSAVRDNAENYFLLDFLSGEYIQLTEKRGLFAEKAYYDRLRDKLYYTTNKSIYSVDIRTLENMLVYVSETDIGSLGITCDGKYLISSASETTERKNNDGVKLIIKLYRMFKVDLATGQENTILYRSSQFDHIQCNPTNPDYIMYCSWGYLCTHQRIWWTNLSGTRGGPIGIEMPNEHRTHEYFSNDGRQIAYHGKFFSYDNKMNFENIGHTWGIMNADGSDDRYYRCIPAGRQAGHSILSHDSKLIAADGNGFISLLELNGSDGTAVFNPVIRHNSSMSGNFVHPHPSFSNDDRYIVYATDSGGKDGGNIYLVDLHSK